MDSALGDAPRSIIVRSVSAFMVDSAAVHIRQFGGDPDCAIILMTILSANLAHLAPQSSLARQAGPGGSFEGVDLRAISIASLSRSIHIPFETVRRKTTSLRETGYLEIGRSGVVIRPAGFQRPDFLATAETSFARLAGALQELERLGLNLAEWRSEDLAALPPTSPLLHRLMYDFQTRQLEILPSAFFKSNLKGILWSTVLDFNLKHARTGRETAYRHALQQLSDDERTPVTVRAVATRLGLPFETVRRNLHDLEVAGAIRRAGARGYIAPRPVAVPPAWMLYNEQLIGAFTRLVSDLWRVGYVLPRPMSDG